MDRAAFWYVPLGDGNDDDGKHDRVYQILKRVLKQNTNLDDLVDPKVKDESERKKRARDDDDDDGDDNPRRRRRGHHRGPYPDFDPGPDPESSNGDDPWANEASKRNELEQIFQQITFFCRQLHLKRWMFTHRVRHRPPHATGLAFYGKASFDDIALTFVHPELSRLIRETIQDVDERAARRRMQSVTLQLVLNNTKLQVPFVEMINMKMQLSLNLRIQKTYHKYRQAELVTLFNLHLHTLLQYLC